MPQNSGKQRKAMADVYICDTTNLRAVGISEVHFIFKRIWKYEKSLADCKKQGTSTNCWAIAFYLEFKFIVLGLDAKTSWMHDYDIHEALYLNCEI